MKNNGAENKSRKNKLAKNKVAEKTTFANMLKQKKSLFVGINGGQFNVDTPAQVGQDILRVVNEFAFN